jgi:hypothetical protein
MRKEMESLISMLQTDVSSEVEVYTQELNVWRQKFITLNRDYHGK